MFVPNDNGYPTMVYNKILGIPGYKIVYNVEEHEALLKSFDKSEPKSEPKSYVKKPLKYTEGVI